jgi:hypothetical protein
MNEVITNLIDRSNFIKGLLVLITKDKKITKEESLLLRETGISFGFSSEFLDESIDEALHNEFITKDPPKFTNNSLAYNFLHQGIKLALSDSELNSEELKYLIDTAAVNGISLNDFNSIMVEFQKSINTQAVNF